MPKGSDEDLGRGNDAGRPRKKLSDETIEGRDVTQKQLKALQIKETAAIGLAADKNGCFWKHEMTTSINKSF